MAPGKPSIHPTRDLTSDHFVESCGAILFDLSDINNQKICIVKPKYDTNEWLIAKGRRNHGESRKEAAIREVTEETGYRCKIFPVTMPTHTTPPDADVNIPDRTRTYEGLSEPFWVSMREMKRPIRTKIIWWYIAVLEDENALAEKLPGEEKYEPRFVGCDEALEMLTYQTDRDLVAKAIELVRDTLLKKEEPVKVSKNKEKAAAKKAVRKAARKAGEQSKPDYVLPRHRRNKGKGTESKTGSALLDSGGIPLGHAGPSGEGGNVDGGEEHAQIVNGQPHHAREHGNANEESSPTPDVVKAVAKSKKPKKNKKQKLRELAAQKQASIVATPDANATIPARAVSPAESGA